MTTLFMLAALIWTAAGVAALCTPRRLGDVRCPLLGVTCLLFGAFTVWMGFGGTFGAGTGAAALLVSTVVLSSVLVLNRSLTRQIRRDAVHLADNELAAAVLDTAGALVVVLDAEGAIVRFNRACETLTGYSASEAIGRKVWDFLLTEEEVDSVRSVFAELRSGHFPNQHENYWVRKDGGRRLVAWSNTAIVDATGAVQFVIGTGVDVTDQRRIEADLRKSEERFSKAFHGSPQSLIIATLEDGVIQDVNQAFVDLFGFTRHELIGRPTKALGMWDNPDDRDLFMQRLVACGAVRDESARFRDRSGRLRLARVWMEIIELQGRRCVLGVVEDVTERLRSENALRESEQKYRTLFDTSRDGIVYVTLDGRITDANAAYVDLTGFSLQELRALRYQDLTPPTWHEMEADIIRSQVTARGYSDDYEKEYVRKDGRVIPVSVRAWVIRDESGGPISMWARVIDISEHRRLEAERSQLEKQLRHSQKMEAIGTLTAGVAHDFNNLLMAISGYVDVAAACADEDNEELQSAVAGIRQAAQQATHITKSMLTFSRKAALTRAPVSLSRLVESATGMLTHLIGRRITLDAQVDAREDVWIEADAAQVQQVLMNLAINARDAMPDGGRLQIALRRAERRSEDLPSNVPLFQAGTAVLTVTDTGCGMNEEVRSRVFEPFFTTKPRGQGTGLGLSVVHGIIAEHRGYIDVRSAPDKGTTVVIALPCVSPRTGPGKEPVAEQPGHGELVLVVEPEPAVRAVVTSALRHAGYRVVGASGDEEARFHIQREAEALCAMVASIDAPEDIVIKCAAELRRRGSRAAIVLTANSATVPAETLRSLDADLLTKPFSLPDLTALVSRRIGASQAANRASDSRNTGSESPSGASESPITATGGLT